MVKEGANSGKDFDNQGFLTLVARGAYHPPLGGKMQETVVISPSDRIISS